MTRFWHPVANMHAVERDGELVLDRADGIEVWDEQGRRYLDATASLWYCNVGYGRQEIVDAVAAQMRKLPAYSAYDDLATRPTIELAERIARIAPMPDVRVFFASGGAESIETAAKLARRYWSHVGQPERRIVISRERAYHGMAAYGTSLAGAEVFKAGLGTLVADAAQVPWDSAGALRETIGQLGPERVAAFVCEPVIGAGGALAPPPGYLDEVRQICRDADVFFIADEVICGYGRVGDWFASSRFGLEPDMVTFAKGITSGYLPLGGLIVGARIAEPFWNGEAGLFRHGYTYSGHASATAAAHPNLDIVEREGLPARALELELELTEALAPLAGHPLVTEVRSGVGVIAAVQPDPALVAADPTLPDRLRLACRASGVLTRTLVGGGLQVSPALTVTRPQLDEIAAGIAAGLDAVAATVPAAAAS
ncbi:MAG: aminotransferase class III-fold pyridoxal phosphate-dependent enzyme [Thermoleophilia bacterium]|nr:aminotransferase class III-fold pyridoxal phosphate-dependent enzyme [Thermoleophilia bacterium]